MKKLKVKIELDHKDIELLRQVELKAGVSLDHAISIAIRHAYKGYLNVKAKDWLSMVI